MSTKLLDNFNGLNERSDQRKLPEKFQSTVNNLYPLEGNLIVRPPIVEDEDTFVEWPSGNFVDIFDFQGTVKQATILAGEQSLYASLAEHFNSVAGELEHADVASGTFTDGHEAFRVFYIEGVGYFGCSYPTGLTDTISFIFYDLDIDRPTPKLKWTGQQDISPTGTNILGGFSATMIDTTTLLLIWRTSSSKLQALAVEIDIPNKTATPGSVTTFRPSGSSSVDIVYGVARSSKNQAVIAYYDATDSKTYTFGIINEATPFITAAQNVGWNVVGSGSSYDDTPIDAYDVIPYQDHLVAVVRSNGTQTSLVILHYGERYHVNLSAGLTLTGAVAALREPRLVSPKKGRLFVVGRGSGTNNIYCVPLSIIGQTITQEAGELLAYAATSTAQVRGATLLGDRLLLATVLRTTTNKFDLVIIGFDDLDLTSLGNSQDVYSITGGITTRGLLGLSTKYALLYSGRKDGSDGADNLLFVLTTTISILINFSTPVTSVDMAGYNELLYCANIMKKTDMSVVHDIGVDSPPDAPTLTTSTVSLALSGTYDYVYTYFNKTWDIESGPSPAASEVEVTNESIILTAFDTTSDTQVTEIRVYRRKVSAGEELHYLVDSIPLLGTAMTFTDSISDNSVSQIITAPTFDGTPDRCFLIAFYKDRMWYADFENSTTGERNPHLVMFSDVGRPDIVSPENFIRIGGNDSGNRITALVPYLQNLVIFKDRSVWILQGDSPDNFEVQMVAPDVGAVSHRSIVQVEDLLFFATRRGPYTFDGSKVTYLGREVERTWGKISGSKLEDISIADDQRRGLIYFLLPVESTENLNTILCFNYRENTWSTWDVGSVGVISRVSENDAFEVMFGMGNQVGRLSETATYTHTWGVVWGSFNFNRPDDPAHFNNMEFILSNTTYTVTVTMGYYLNETEKNSVVRSHINRFKEHVPIGRRGEVLAPFIEGTGKISILGLAVKGNEIGRR